MKKQKNFIDYSKKTKIVATIGPATESFDVMQKLAYAGMNVIRLNMSHGSWEEYDARIETARRVTKETGIRIGILQDLSGPKIRIGDFYKDRIVLKNGQTFTLTTKACVGDEKRVFVNYKKLSKEVKKGSIIMLDDGKKKLEVLRIEGDDIVCKVLYGGDTKGRRGVNVPGAYLSINSITEKDKKDLAEGLKHKLDFIALSFVRSYKDIIELRGLLKKAKSDAMIIAKIETLEAVEGIDGIIEHADGIMVARGDLAIEVGAELVPGMQKMIIKKCNDAGKPVITATQMLESMIHSPVPTRAEVSDIANAIFDGTDAIMLSEETTLGEYPIRAVETMTTVAHQAEGDMKTHRRYKVRVNSIADSVSSSVVHNAEDVGAKAIVALTESGFTARMVSRYKPMQPIIVFSPNDRVSNKLTLSYGCYPFVIKQFKYVGEVTDLVKEILVREKIGKKGDRAVIAAGVPFGRTGSTNMMVIHRL